jgi:hypothetical protein
VPVVHHALLTPPCAATGAPIASSVAYLTTNAVLVTFFVRRAAAVRAGGVGPGPDAVGVGGRRGSLPAAGGDGRSWASSGLVALPNGWHVTADGVLVDRAGVLPSVRLAPVFELQGAGT